jgi:hypothetical protein
MIMLHRDSIVQLTHDLSMGQDVLLRQGIAGRVVSTTILHRECIVEFTVSNEQTTITTKVGDRDLVEVLPNARA